MVQPDPALGFNVAFPSMTVRNGLLFAMQLGSPNEIIDVNGNPVEKRRVRFIRRDGAITYYREGSEAPLALSEFRRDRDGRPLDPTIRMVKSIDTEVPVDVAIELTEATADELPVGNFRQVKATITLMGQEYEQVKGCRELIYNNDRYGFGYELDAHGLFDLTFHTLLFYAIDES